VNLPLVQIAAAFLVAISACASLIVSANAKHERLSRLFRATCTEWRKEDSTRKENLRKQAGYFRERYYVIQKVQTELFRALRSFVRAFFFFVALAISVSVETYLAGGSRLTDWIGGASIILGLMIACFFVNGLRLMISASGQQLNELRDSHRTLECEAEDVFESSTKTTAPDQVSKPTRVPELIV